MAETMTYDPGTDTVTTEGTLTPDEQDSLQVGEAMQEQQEQLLAGKYKDAADLEKAYIELQKKLGDDTTTEAPEVETKEEKSTDEPQYYLEDGVVNYAAVNEAYGDKLGDLFKEAEVDPWSISEHFHSNNGTITDEMYTSLESAGLSRASIDSYLAGRAIESGYSEEVTAAELSDSEVNSVRSIAGTEKDYNNLIQWAGTNLEQQASQAFDSIVNSGDVEMIKLAVTGLKAQYDNANGYEGRMLTGKAASGSSDVFRSQPELVAAMSDPRYDKDPAYRQDVIEKLDRSDLNF